MLNIEYFVTAFMPGNIILLPLSNRINAGEKMQKKLNQKRNHITTDDLAFSAYLKMRGYLLIRSNNIKSKMSFVFNIENNAAEALKLEFINS